MITRAEAEQARRRAAAMLREAGIVLTPQEEATIEIADLGLGELERQGLELVTYVNTDRYCAKELVPAHPGPRATSGCRRDPPGPLSARFITASVIHPSCLPWQECRIIVSIALPCGKGKARRQLSHIRE